MTQRPDSPRRRTLAARLLWAFQLGLITLLAILIGQRFTNLFDGASASIGALWCALTGIVVLHATRRETWKEGIRQVLGALIGALVSAAFLLVLPISPIVMAVSVAVTVFICLMSGLSDSSKLAAASVVMIMVISSTNPNLNPVLNAALRFCEAAIGASIAMVIELLSPQIESEETI